MALEGDPKRERLISLVMRLETLRGRIPYSLTDGSLEEALKDIAFEVSVVERGAGTPEKPAVVRTMLFSDLHTEALLLSQLASALGTRIRRYGRPDITGLDYLEKRLDMFLEKMRAYLGFHPKVPLHMQQRRK